MEAFPKNGGTFQIEPDTSSGSYFLAAERLVPHAPEYLEYSEQFGIEVPTQQMNRINVAHWPDSGWQMDEPFRDYLMLGSRARELRELDRKHAPVTRNLLDKLKEQTAKWIISRKNDLGDSIMTAIIWSAEEEARFCLLDQKAFHFTDLGRLRVQECERVVALRTELTKCGAKVVEEGDTLTVWPSPLHGAEIETYNDHRMAMCFAILGLKVPGIKIKNPACVKKTFPNFFQKLAAPPPHGLGATILDANSGRKLAVEELFAD
jgi:3-phosphoshikimate 1-carboxyvinyltransferase